MKKIHLLLAFVLFTVNVYAQDNILSGSWKGTLDVMGQKLPLIFHFEKTDEGWKGTADSPAQGAKGMLLKNILYNGLMASWEFEQIPALYEGVVVGDTLKGNFTQSGNRFPLNLAKTDQLENEEIKRPQEPKPPFDYEEIETSFRNSADQSKIVGTITKPLGPGPFPAVVLVSGSGPQDRNGEIFGHKPFWVIADYLTRNGIIVFRYDERGVGESEGDFATASSYDFKEDGADALSHLRKFPFVNQSKVGVMGHSEGGMIGWMLAADKRPNFLVAMAAPVVPIVELMEQQTLDVLKSTGANQELIDQRLTLNKKVYQAVAETGNFIDLESNVKEMLKEHLTSLGVDDEALEAESTAIMEVFGPTMTPWFFEFMKFTSQPFIEQINIPVFAAFAEKDIQVNASANAQALKEMTVNQEGLFEIVAYPNFNHLFQTAETGAVSEYATNTETFNEQVLNDILVWISSMR